MSSGAGAAVFFLGTATSLAASWLVVSRIERLGSRLGATGALLGVIAALAGDGPEITSAVSALLDHQPSVAAGVAVGSNVFNLAALLGLGAVLAGGIHLRRKAILLEGALALWIAAGCLMTLVGAISAAVGLAAVTAVLAVYVALAAMSRELHSSWLARGHWRRWLSEALREEELEVAGVTTDLGGRARDAIVGVAALVVVVVASAAMERSASEIGGRLHLSGIVVGGIVLAAVTSLPNVVAAAYWARRGRGAALLSTGLNSNAFNVAAGLLLPAVLLGLSRRTVPEVVTGAWYFGLTVVVLALALRRAALSRLAGLIIIVAYLVYVAVMAVGV